MKVRTKKNPDKKYRYVVKVVEEVESSAVIESSVPLRWNELREISESRRVKGQLSFCGVRNVDTWCAESYVDGKLKLKQER